MHSEELTSIKLMSSMSTIPYDVMDNLKKHASNRKFYPQLRKGRTDKHIIRAFFSKKYIVFESKQDSLHQAGVANSAQTKVNQVTSEALINIQCTDEIHEQ